MIELTHQSPLQAARGSARPVELERDGLYLCERPLVNKAVLRTTGDSALHKSAENLIGVELPWVDHTVQGEGPFAIWLGSNHWLISHFTDVSLVSALRKQTSGMPASVQDMSDGLFIFKLSEARASDILSTGCALDLHPRSFGPGRAAQVSLAGISVIVHQVSAQPSFELYVDRDLAWDLWQWLQAAVDKLD